MDLQKIKQFVKQSGDTFVIIEEGEPSLVVMSFEGYEKIRNGKQEKRGNPHQKQDFEVIAASLETERIRKKQEETEWSGYEEPHFPERRPENIRLEDLPL